MDYLEGILLHSWWSDTDYESRKHTGTWLWFSFFSFVFLALSAFLLNYRGTFSLYNHMDIWKLLTITLFLITPFLCMIYYRLPFFLRFPILFVLGLKYISAFLYAMGNIVKIFIIPKWLTLDYVMVWGNETFGKYLEERTTELGVNGLFVGGAVIAGIAIVIALLAIIVIIVVPIFLLQAFNAFQYVWDSIFIWIFGKAKELYHYYQNNPNKGGGKNQPKQTNKKPGSDRPDQRSSLQANRNNNSRMKTESVKR